MRLFDPGMPTRCIVDVESSWDDQPWTWVWSGQFTGVDWNLHLRRWPVTSKPTPGPHRVAVRVTKLVVESKPGDTKTDRWTLGPTTTGKP